MCIFCVTPLLLKIPVFSQEFILLRNVIQRWVMLVVTTQITMCEWFAHNSLAESDTHQHHWLNPQPLHIESYLFHRSNVILLFGSLTGAISLLILLLLLFFFGWPLLKSLRFCRLKSDQDESRQKCSSSKCASSEGVHFSIWHRACLVKVLA